MDKLAFMRKINTAIELLQESKICNEQIARLEPLCQRLKNKEFIISVFGQFKRGKSSFINAILGEDILPVGIVPVTSVVTRIKYGKKSADVFFMDGSQRIPFEELSNFINEQHNPGNIKKVDSVQINYPSALLSSGLTIVDTPGVGSMHKHNSEAAYAFVKNSDAVIFMLSVDSPVNEIESKFLSEIKEYASKIYYTVNKTDIVTSDELAEYIAYCQKLLCDITDVKEIKLYPICAKNKQDHGLQQLTKDIFSDIALFGEDILLNSIRIKSADILKEALGQIELYISALGMPLNKLEDTAEALKNRLDILESMSKETAYLIDQRTDELIENIRQEFENEQQKITSEISLKIKTAYEEFPQLKSRLFEEKLDRMVESYLTPCFSTLNEKGISMLKKGYEEATALFGENLDKIHIYLNDVIKELFNVDYHFDKEIFSLSEATNFYISINPIKATFFFDASSMIRFLPKAMANKAIFDRVLKCANEDVSRNITNMLSDYSYKIRESKREFKARFVSKANELKTSFKNFTERILLERKMTGDQYDDKIVRMEQLNNKILQCIDEIL